MDVVLLSRVQFALTIMFHYLFPPLTIGMGVVLVYLEGMYLWKKEPIYETAARFWTQLFAVTFAVGVASGIVMEFQFGTNWAVYSRFVGDVFGSALAAEGIFAFFLESGFLAVLVFGWDKVSAGFHFFATLMVALGSMFSAIWIVVANSWQQTPAGHHFVQMMRDGQPWAVDGEPIVRAEIVSFWEVVFNPSTLERLSHTLIGAFIMGAFFIMSISAYYLLKNRHLDFAKRSFTGALLLASFFCLVQLVSGHSNALMVSMNQPAKLAAYEGHFKTGPGDLSLIGLPIEDEQRVAMNLAVPGLLSVLVHGDSDTPVSGLDRFRPEDRPPLLPTYFSYRIMVGLGMTFIALTLFSLFLLWRGKLFNQRWLLKIFVVAVLGAVAANQLGWIAAEIGRQPWVVYPVVERDSAGKPLLDAEGFVRYRSTEFPAAEGTVSIAGLRTKDAVSETVGSTEVLASMVMFGLIYLLLGALWVLVLDRKIRKGPIPVAARATSKSHGLLDSATQRLGREGVGRQEEDES